MEKIHSGFYNAKDHHCKNSIKKKLFRLKTDHEIVSQFIKENSRILDYGCGNGALFDFLNKKFKNLNLVGFDTDKTCINICKKKGHTVFDSFNKIKGTFDYIICNQVIAYLDEKEIIKFFDRSSKYLKKDGKLIISAQNAKEFYSFMSLWDRPGHIRLYSSESLRRLGRQFNFKILKIIKHHIRMNPIKILINLILGLDICSGICVIFVKNN